MMEVLVFKTNVEEQSEVSKLYSLLMSFADIKQVTVDMEDRDRVLRIVGDNPSASLIKSLVRSLGLACSELDD
jgi:hypothetical protein